MFETSRSRGTFVAIVPSPPKDPRQRRRRNAEPPKRATSTALPAESKRKAPPPPSWLAKRLHPQYRAVWRSSVAHLWPPSVGELVARLVDERDRLRRLGDDASPALRSVVLQLERELLLGPRAARASGVTMRDEADVPAQLDVGDDDDVPAAAAKTGTGKITKARRDRVLRVVQ